jgi:hypothetical protein
MAWRSAPAAGGRKPRLALLLSSLAILTLVVTAAAARSPLNLTLSGKFKTVALRGKVQFGTVNCIPVKLPATNVEWTGQIGTGKTAHRLAGEIDFHSTGKQTFGPSSSAIATLVVDGDYKDSLAAGLPGAGGTGTVAKNARSGTVSITLVDGRSKVLEHGSWACG